MTVPPDDIDRTQVDSEFAAALARRRRRRQRQRIAALVVLAGMVLGFSGLFVFERNDPSGHPVPADAA